MLVVNEGEANALLKFLNKDVLELGLPHLVITLGSRGARYIGEEGEFFIAPFEVSPVDTTGAGDTFLGYLLASLSKGMRMKEAMR